VGPYQIADLARALKAKPLGKIGVEDADLTLMRGEGEIGDGRLRHGRPRGRDKQVGSVGMGTHDAYPYSFHGWMCKRCFPNSSSYTFHSPIETLPLPGSIR